MVKQIIKRYQRQNLSWPKDWFIKFISVLFAVFLWFFVAGEDRVDMNVQIPLEIVNLPRDMIISNQFKTQLEVTVSGPRGIIKKIAQQSVSRSIDLSGATPGNIVINNASDSIKFPRGIETLRINPSQIVLLIDRLIEKTIPIDPISSGDVSDSFELDFITLTPDTLTVSGPLEVLKSTTSVKTQPIDLSDMTSSAIKQISLDLLPEVADLIGESIVTAQITIKDKMVEKKIRRVPISIHGFTDSKTAKLSPAKITIKAQIPKAIIKDTKKLSTLFEPSIDISTLPVGTHEVQVELKESVRISIVDLEPKTVQVILKAKEIVPKSEKKKGQ